MNCQNQDVELQMLNHLGINILPDEGNKFVLIISLPPISSNHYTVKFPSSFPIRDSAAAPQPHLTLKTSKKMSSCEQN